MRVRVDEARDDRQAAAVDLLVHGRVDDVARQVRIAAGKEDPLAVRRDRAVGDDGDVALLRSRRGARPAQVISCRTCRMVSRPANGQERSLEKAGRDIVR